MVFSAIATQSGYFIAQNLTLCGGQQPHNSGIQIQGSQVMAETMSPALP